VTEIVVRDRVVPRILALLPAIAVAIAVRVMTLGSRPEPLRVAAAAVVALACWTAYRLLTVRVTVADHGIVVRGVFYDAEIGYDDLHAVAHSEPSLPVRVLIWGTMKGRAVTIEAAGRRMRPLALLSFADDVDIDRAVDAMVVRTGARRRVPAQRQPNESGARVR
jgi:hypothetical protein